ncbi:C45 family autoproteolytic acyltransferase/hydolase [Oceanobacillus sp. 1P07AA]|uniref:C45 family autoproteolytic acyltransferase/hydolase n=1 Tax=Oceanobacillus sp. 1P07AA TaxID=3132293 RepID=UPI0039A4662F
MQQIYTDVITFRGSHYHFGKMQGESIKNSFVMENRKKQWKLRRPRFTVNIDEVKAMINAYAPGIWEELEGIRDGIEWSLSDTLQEFAGYRINLPSSGCSVFTSSNYMIRNYDYHPKTYEGRLVLFQPTDTGLTCVGPSQRITGRLDGMNQHGLVLGYNFTHRKKPGEGFICNMISRIVLETCSNVEQAVHLLQEIPHRYAFSYLVLDQHEETFIIEGSARGTSVRKGNLCTNHFENLTTENRNYLDDSYRRLFAMQNNSTNKLSAEEAFRMMNGTDRGVFSKQYKNWGGTIHTSGYLPAEKKVWFSLGGDTEPYVIDFGKWMEGQEILEKRLFGEVDTTLPFAHMEGNVR